MPLNLTKRYSQWLGQITLLCICMPTANAQITWVNASGGNFLSGSNWSSGLSPVLENDYVLNIATSAPVTLGGSVGVNNFSLQNVGTTMNQTAGTFTIANVFTLANGSYNLNGGVMALGAGLTMNGGTFNFNSGTINNSGSIAIFSGAAFGLNGGTINGGSLSTVGTGSFLAMNNTSNILNGVTVTGTVDVGSNSTSGMLTLSGGTSFTNGSLVNLSAVNRNGLLGINQSAIDNVTINTYGFDLLSIQGNNVLSFGSGVIYRSSTANTSTIGSNLFGGGSGSSSLINNGIIEKITTSGNINIVPSGSFSNSGSVRSSATGAVITINPIGTFSNNGTLNASNGGLLSIERNLTTGQLGTWSSNGGTVRLFNLTLDNSNASLNITASTGALTLRNTTVIGGSIDSSTSLLSVESDFAGMTLLSGVSISGAVSTNSNNFTRLRLNNNSTFATGSTINLRTNSTLRISQPQLDNVLIFGSASNFGLTIEGTSQLTLGSNTHIDANFISQIGGDIFFSGGGSEICNLVNNGLIDKNASGTTIINPTGSFINNGTIRVDFTGGLGNSFRRIDIKPTSTFTNAGLLDSRAGTISIQRDLSTAQLGTWLSLGPTFELSSATLSNTSSTLILSSINGALTLNQSAIVGGNIFCEELTAPLYIVGSSNLVSTNISGTISMYSGFDRLTLSGNTTFSPGSLIQGSGSGSDYLGVNQSFIDNLSIRLVPLSIQGSNTLTLGSNVIINSNIGSNSFGGSLGTSNLISNGIIDGNSRSIVVNPSGTFTNNGIIRSGASFLSVVINPAGGLVLGASSQLITTNGGVIRILSSSVTNSGIVDLSAGLLDISTINAATYNVTPTGSTSVGNTAVINIGNTSTSQINNAGAINVSMGGTINLGPTASPGSFTNNSNGTLVLNGTLNAQVTASGGLITGNGTINASPFPSVISLPGSILAPGNSPGTITIGGGLVVGGTLELDIASGGQNNNSNATGPNQTPGTGFDTITVRPPPTAPTTPTNASIRTSTVNFNLRTSNTSQSNFDSDGFWGSSQRWAFVRTTATNVSNAGEIELRDENNNLLLGLVPASVRLFNVDGTEEFSALSAHPNGAFFMEVIPSSNPLYRQQLDLVWQPVPEPSTIFAISALTLGTASWLRRRYTVRNQSFQSV